jgi:hypothetical protein
MPDHQTLEQALVAAQTEMPAVEPDSVNPHFRSRYVSLDHLIAKTRPVLNRHGLAVTQEPTHIEGEPALRTTVVHVSGESRSSVMPLLLTKRDSQGVGGALTYSRRYAWAALLGVSADEDDDGNQVSSGPPAAAAAPVPAAAAASGEPYVFKTGKYAGQMFSDVPTAYLTWYLEKGPLQAVKAEIIDYQAQTKTAPFPDEDIPF